MNTTNQPIHNFGNPNIFGLSAFGFSLFLLGMEMVVSREIAGAVLYAIAFAGVMEFLAGMWMIAKGESYLASILTVFGAWLLGFFLMLTQGKALGVYNGMSAGWYMLAIEPPIVMLAIPAFVQRKWVLSAAFAALFFLVFALGIGFIKGDHSWLFAAGVLAFTSAFFIWWLLWHNIHALISEH